MIKDTSKLVCDLSQVEKSLNWFLSATKVDHVNRATEGMDIDHLGDCIVDTSRNRRIAEFVESVHEFMLLEEFEKRIDSVGQLYNQFKSSINKRVLHLDCVGGSDSTSGASYMPPIELQDNFIRVFDADTSSWLCLLKEEAERLLICVNSIKMLITKKA